MTHSKTAILLLALSTACAGEFNPNLDSEPTSESDSVEEGSSSDEGGSDTQESDSSVGNGSSSSGFESESSDEGETTLGEEPEVPADNPGPNDPCDPILAFQGISPCEDPESQATAYTCAAVQLMPDPGVTAYEFRCVEARDGQSDGWGIGDSCTDDSGGAAGTILSSGCLNSWCLWNGLNTNPETDTPWGHPEGACPFQPEPPEGPYSHGCCVPYCNDENPCDPGWTCVKNTAMTVPNDEVGACVWM